MTTDAISVFFVPQSQAQKMDLCLIKIEVGRFEKEGVFILPSQIYESTIFFVQKSSKKINPIFSMC
nr:hypothetical protein BCV14_19995 [Vibrio cyclitrophicus]